MIGCIINIMLSHKQLTSSPKTIKSMKFTLHIGSLVETYMQQGWNLSTERKKYLDFLRAQTLIQSWQMQKKKKSKLTQLIASEFRGR